MDEEIQQLKQRVREAADEFGKGSREYQQANAAYTRALRSQVNSMLKFTSTVTGLAGSLARGNTNMSQLNGMISTVTNSLSALTLAYPPLAAGIKLLGEGVEFAMESFDQALGTFYKLSESGALGAEGIDSLRKQFVRAGIPMQRFEQIILRNTESLAGLYGTVTEGAEELSGVAGMLKASGLDNELRSLGFRSEDVANTFSDYANIQRRVGAESARNQGMLTAGTLEYGKQLDLLAKVTGKTRDQQQNALDAALSEGRYRANRARMEAAGQGEAAKALDNFMLVVNSISPTLGQAIRDTAGGFISTQAAQQGFISTGGALPNIIAGLKSGQLDFAQAVGMVQDATKTQLPAMESIAVAVGDTTGAFVPFAEGMDLTTFALGDLEGALKRAKDTQDVQSKAMEVTGPTQALINVNKQLETASSKFQATALSFDSIATGADALMELIDKTSDLVYNTVGTFGDEDPRERLRSIQENTKDIQNKLNTFLSDENIEGVGASPEIIDRLEKELAKSKEQEKYYRRMVEGLKNKPLTFKGALMNTNQYARDNSFFGGMDFINPVTQGEATLDSELGKRGIAPGQVMTPSTIQEYNKLVDKFDFDTTNKYFLDEVKKLFENQMNIKTEPTASVDVSPIVTAVVDNAKETNKKLDTLIAQNNTAKDQRNKHIRITQAS